MFPNKNEPVRPSITLPQNYRLIWQDTFRGHKLNSKKWRPLIRVRGDAHDVATAVSVSNGLRIITYSKNAVNYTGFISTRKLFEPKFGFYEARIKFHDSPGEWCAFWLQSPTNGHPVGDPATAGMEIDIAEHRFVNARGISIQKSTRMGALHWNGYGKYEKDIRSQLVPPPDGKSCQGHFHTYGLLWIAAGYQFYVDGRKVVNRPARTNPVSKTHEFLYLSCEVENHDWAGAIPPNGYGNRTHSRTGMTVSWVRVWQANPNRNK